MTQQTLEAMYEHGIFRLIQPPTVPLHEGWQVLIVIETDSPSDNVFASATTHTTPPYVGTTEPALFYLTAGAGSEQQACSTTCQQMMCVKSQQSHSGVMRPFVTSEQSPALVAGVYADLRQHGYLIDDADILITAFSHGS
jgi:predicted DNA-binding antitoxin AbrB/MazE fold protein